MSLEEKALLLKQDFDDVHEAGKKENQEAFANSFHSNGTRGQYTYAYSYSGWKDDTFEQSLFGGLVIKPTACNQMFFGSWVENVAEIMERHNVTFDFSSNSLAQAYAVFANSKVKHLPILVMPTASTAYGWFEGCKTLHTIDGMVCNEKTLFQTSSGANKTFLNCTQLTHCIFSGVIANDINVQWCPFDDDSLISIVEALRNLYEDINLDTGEIPDRTLILHPDCWVRLKSMIYPDKAAIEAGLSYTYYDLILRKGWKTA